MPSINKTPHVGLNQWEGNERPKRVDFVEDNALIDEHLKALANKAELTVVSSVPDADGVYKTVTWTRRDGTTYAKSTLSGAPYNNLTVVYYDKTGTGVDKTISWNLTIDANGIVSRKELTA